MRLAFAPLLAVLLAFCALARPGASGSTVVETRPVGDDERHVLRKTEAEALAAIVDSTVGIGFTGSILLARDGKVLVATGVGWSSRRAGRACTANTLFEVASVTKPFTAAAIGALVQDERLDLDDPISKYLPAVPENCAAITIRHLLQHTSGIPGTNVEGGGSDLKAVVTAYLAGGPQHEVGSHFEYWNQGYALLAAIIESVTGDDVVEVTRSEVLRPARMKLSLFTGEKRPKKSDVSTGRSESAEGTAKERSALDHPYGAYDLGYKGMGGLVTNVWELWRFDQALHRRKPLGDDFKAEMFEPGEHGYGLGWFVRRDGERLVQSHSGRVRGFVSELRRYPEEEALLVILSNDDNVMIHRLGDYLEGALFGEDVERIPGPLFGKHMGTLIGEYVSSEDRRAVVTRLGDVYQMTIHPADGGAPRSGFVGTDPDDDNRAVFWDWGATYTPVNMRLPDTDNNIPWFALDQELFAKVP